MNASPQPESSARASTIDASEIERFSALAADWWSPKGPMAPLHAMNPARLGFIRDQVVAALGRPTGALKPDLKPLAGLRALDIGCGAGLVAEPLARMGADVTGLDASAELIAAAQAHAEAMALTIDYRIGEAPPVGDSFDLITALEVVEHVADVDGFLANLRAASKPGGCLVMSTLNRTARSFLTAIVGAEYVLRLLPRGTHNWRKFRTPAELGDALTRAGFQVQTVRGLTFDPLRRDWRISQENSIGYILMARAAAC